MFWYYQLNDVRTLEKIFNHPMCTLLHYFPNHLPLEEAWFYNSNPKENFCQKLFEIESVFLEVKFKM